MNLKSLVNSPQYLLNHTVMYEIILTNNGKYIGWKLLFPRVGDSLYTVDKLMDLHVWKELYSVLNRISTEYDVSAALVPQMMIDKNRYKLCFKKIEITSLQTVFNVDMKLIREMLCAELLLNNDGNQSPVATPVTARTIVASSPGENGDTNRLNTACNAVMDAVNGNNLKRSHPDSDSSSDSEVSLWTESAAALKRIKIQLPLKSTAQNIQSTSKVTMYSNASSAPKKINVNPPVKSVIPKEGDSSSDESSSDSASETKKIEVNPPVKPVLPKDEDSSSDESSSDSALTTKKITVNPPVKPVLPKDEDSSSDDSSSSAAIKKIQVHPPLQSVIYKVADSSSDSSDTLDDIDVQWSPESTSYKNVAIPTNLQELRKLMMDSKYLKRFGYEMEEKEKYRHYDDIYPVDGQVSYAAFRSSNMIEMLRGKECTFLFHFSKEMVDQINSLREIKFTGVNHVLMVYESTPYDRINPIAIFLLSDKDQSLGTVLSVINGWLNGTNCSTDVTKCITPYDPILKSSIAAIWQKAKIIGCSAQYQREIKEFAKRNKGLGAEHKTKLTRLACSLCYLKEEYIPTGIDVIQDNINSKLPEYGVALVDHLRVKWQRILKSVHRERIMHRSLTICQQYSKRIEREHFQRPIPFIRAARTQQPHQHVWEYIDCLRSLTSMAVLETTIYRDSVSANFGYNTDLQKEKEHRCHSAWAEFDENLKTMTEQEAVERFMLKISLNL